MSRYYIIGDLHGDRFALQYLIRNMNIDDDTYIITCGDVGILYGNEKYGSLLHTMSRYPCKFIIMRGNHDSRYWDAYRQRDESFTIFDVWGNKMMRQEKYPNIWYVRDEGGLYEIPQIGNCLFVPGAYSVDKWYRLQNGLPWEHDEQLTYVEMDALIKTAKTNQVDYVFSHTCPKSWQQQFTDLFLPYDMGPIDNSMEKWLDVLYDVVKDKYNMWYFGHYHDDRYVVENDEIVGIMLYKSFDEIGA